MELKGEMQQWLKNESKLMVFGVWDAHKGEKG